MAPTPAFKRKIIKKRTATFPRFQSDRFKRVGVSWRKPKGIDCRVRRRFKGTNVMPNIGYASNKKTRHVLPNGFYKFRVFNVKDVEMLIMQNRKFCVEIASGVSTRKRSDIIARASELNMLVTNKKAKLQVEEKQ
eukprot:GHVU01109155.1.p2 GENE.GHVU01109155.1~~GHVU01109155.1.p2  ORF type:complete len:135 (-),score=28.11 GHVU01109155.1:978-1382(-)